MYKTICVTSRALAGDAFLQRIEAAVRRADAVILREKDLSGLAYEMLARQVLPICEDAGVLCLLHGFVDAAKRLRHPHIHLPMARFLELTPAERDFFQTIGVSTHTVEEAIRAELFGASYVTASHIFLTDCKPGLSPRGLDYLRAVTAQVSIPVYALGGIHPETIPLCIDAGAAGVCMMSEFMKGGEPICT